MKNDTQTLAPAATTYTPEQPLEPCAVDYDGTVKPLAELVSRDLPELKLAGGVDSIVSTVVARLDAIFAEKLKDLEQRLKEILDQHLLPKANTTAEQR